MTNKEYNDKAITDAYKNAKIALQSIADLLPSVEHKELKKELKTQYEGYKTLTSEMAETMKQNGLKPQELNVFKKAMLYGSIKMKTVMNNSKNQVAEMMIKGTVMGINELTAMKNENKNLNEDVKAAIYKLLETEEQYNENLKSFL